MLKQPTSFLLILLALTFTSCANEEGPEALKGTWTFHSGDVAHITHGAPHIPGRHITFLVHENKTIESFNSNGIPIPPISIEGREHKLIFNENDEYIIYSGGLSIDKEGLFDNLPIYESGTYSIKDSCLSFITTTYNGISEVNINDKKNRGDCYKSGGGLSYKVENGTLSLLWKDNYFLFDEYTNKYILIRTEGKLNFTKVSDKILMPNAVPQNTTTPDEFPSPEGTFFGLVLPNPLDNPLFIPADDNPDLHNHIVSQDTILGLKMLSEVKNYALKDISTPEEFSNAYLSIHMLSRVSVDDYLQFRDEELKRLKFEQTEAEYSRDMDKWITNAYKMQFKNRVVYLFEAIRAGRVDSTNAVPRIYIARTFMRLLLPESEGETNERTRALENHREWNLNVQRQLLDYLANDAQIKSVSK